MRTLDFFFQTAYIPCSSKVLGRILNLSNSDKILMTVWMGHIHNLSLRDRYFCFTKEGLYWKFPAIIQIGEEGKTAERTICNSDFFKREGSSFSLVFTKCDDNLNELHIKMGERTFIFQFTKNFQKENLEELERIIRDYFTGYFDEKKYEDKAKKSSLRMALYNIPDFIKQTGFVIVDGYQKFLGKIENFFENLGKPKTDNKTEDFSKTENTIPKQSVEPAVQVQSEIRFVRFIRHTFDLIADLIFVLAIIIQIKPELLYSQLESTVVFFDLTNNFIALIILFLIIKIFVILSCKNIKKIVPFLLLLILCVSCILIDYIFLLFLVLSILLLITLQFSMNFKSKSISLKVKLFVILAIALYISLHIINNYGLVKEIITKLSEFGKTLNFPAKWILNSK